MMWSELLVIAALCTARASPLLLTSPMTRPALLATLLPITLNFSGSPNTPPLDFRYGVDGPHGAMCDNGISVAQELLSFGSTLLRTHDSDVLDWTTYYPHPALDADTTDPASYNWTAGDAYFARVVGDGLEPYFRLGTSWNVLGGGLPPDGVSYNQTALVDVLLHTVMHYNDGWGGDAGGAAGRDGVRYWEIWNEPDSTCTYNDVPGCGRFWNRTALDFYDLVDATTRAIKAYDSTLHVGTCGVANPMQHNTSNPYSFGLIKALGMRETPVSNYSPIFFDTVLLNPFHV